MVDHQQGAAGVLFCVVALLVDEEDVEAVVVIANPLAEVIGLDSHGRVVADGCTQGIAGGVNDSVFIAWGKNNIVDE